MIAGRGLLIDLLATPVSVPLIAALTFALNFPW
jgi:hypothetical protein